MKLFNQIKDVQVPDSYKVYQRFRLKMMMMILGHFWPLLKLIVVFEIGLVSKKWLIPKYNFLNQVKHVQIQIPAWI
jgi:hypothetical protein